MLVMVGGLISVSAKMVYVKPKRRYEAFVVDNGVDSAMHPYTPVGYGDTPAAATRSLVRGLEEWLHTAGLASVERKAAPITASDYGVGIGPLPADASAEGGDGG